MSERGWPVAVSEIHTEADPTPMQGCWCRLAVWNSVIATSGPHGQNVQIGFCTLGVQVGPTPWQRPMFADPLESVSQP